MDKFVRQLLTEWRKLGLPFTCETFVVAVSGGADSVSLALALADLKQRKKLNLRFVVAHFNHDLRGAESRKDLEFVGELAEKLNLEFVSETGKVSKKGNLEQNARLVRYAFLTETAQNLDAHGILTAHTVNDQAETFLLNLIRGSGIDGLSAMKSVIRNYGLQTENDDFKSQIPNPKSQINLVRPLLSWAKRADTESFCRERKIEFRTDAMNVDLDFKRVKIRKILLPALKEFNPKIVEKLAQTARLLQTENEKPETSENLKPETDCEFLVLVELKKLSPAVFNKTIREWLGARRGNLRQLNFKHFEAIERLVFSRKGGRLVELPAGESVLKHEGKLLWRSKSL